MKKWSEPQLLEINLQETKGSECPVDEALRTPWGVFCDKTKPDGSKAYTPTLVLGVCKYHLEGGWCNYQEEGTQS